MGEQLSVLLNRNVILVFDDKDKVSVRHGVVIDVTPGFIIIKTKPKKKTLIEVIPLNRVIRIELEGEK